MKTGESMAQFRAQPRLMTSVALSVRLGSFLKTSFRMLMMDGTLEDPPVTSTDAMSSRLIFASSSACRGGYLRVSNQRCALAASEQLILCRCGACTKACHRRLRGSIGQKVASPCCEVLLYQ